MEAEELSLGLMVRVFKKYRDEVKLCVLDHNGCDWPFDPKHPLFISKIIEGKDPLVLLCPISSRRSGEDNGPRDKFPVMELEEGQANGGIDHPTFLRLYVGVVVAPHQIEKLLHRKSKLAGFLSGLPLATLTKVHPDKFKGALLEKLITCQKGS